MNKTTTQDVILQLNDLKTIRKQAYRLLELARENKSEHFILHEDKFTATASFVAEVIRGHYPDLKIPYHSRWRHFEANGVQRIAALQKTFENETKEEQGKRWYELAIISVLLDAGAGMSWSFHEKKTDQSFNRSEGLALASLELYLNGHFSNDANQPYRVDGERLAAFSMKALKEGFQVSDSNPLAGLQGRLGLLNALGKAIKEQPEFFGSDGRLGNFYTHICSQALDHTLSANLIFQDVLKAFKGIWPKRLQYQGIPLGDVWIHSALKTPEPGSEYVPFHKLSQWLTYSLIEPLEWTGFTVEDLDQLTGLPEYRNGGLLIDMGLLEVRSPEVLKQAQGPDSEVIVEWRALTLALLDELAERIRTHFHKDKTTLPLAKILQGGTWEAGRKIAREKRLEGQPPINIISDGTVF